MKAIQADVMPLKMISLLLHTSFGSQRVSDMMFPPYSEGKKVSRMTSRRPFTASSHFVCEEFFALMLSVNTRRVVNRGYTYISIHVCRTTQHSAIIVRPLAIPLRRAAVLDDCRVGHIPSAVVHQW